jgi:NADPH2:quinone reductase
MRLQELGVPEPGPGQIRIRNRAAALNFFDLLQIQGRYQVKPALPFTPGHEVAGTVDALGEGASGLGRGDRVLARLVTGGFADYSLARAGNTFRIPDSMGFAEAAGMLIVYQTAHYAFTRRTRLERGEWLLVHGGAGGVGTAAVQLGKALGARVIATAGSEEKRAFCVAQGADHVLDYLAPGWVERVKELTGRGADVIYDPVGGDVFDLSTRCLAPEGRLLVVGFASGRIPQIQLNRVLLKNASIVGVNWGAHFLEHPESLAPVQAELFSMYEAGRIAPVVSRSYAFEEAPAALRDLAQRRTHGKVVLALV